MYNDCGYKHFRHDTLDDDVCVVEWRLKNRDGHRTKTFGNIQDATTPRSFPPLPYRWLISLCFFFSFRMFFDDFPRISFSCEHRQLIRLLHRCICTTYVYNIRISESNAHTKIWACACETLLSLSVRSSTSSHCT